MVLDNDEKSLSIENKTFFFFFQCRPFLTSIPYKLSIENLIFNIILFFIIKIIYFFIICPFENDIKFNNIKTSQINICLIYKC